MKKNLIALMVPALVAASAAHADVELVKTNDLAVSAYGEAKIHAGTTGELSGDLDRSYGFEHTIGLKGETAVAPMVKVIAGVEVEGSRAKAINDELEKGFVGVSHAKFGTVTLGKNAVSTDMLTDLVDVFEAEGVNGPAFAASDATFETIAYNGEFAGVEVAADFSDAKDNHSAHVAVGYEMNLEGVSVKPVIAYENVQYGFDKFGLGAGVAYGDFYAAVNMANTEDKNSDDSFKTLDLVAQYSVDALTVRAGLTETKLEDNDAEATYKLEADYALNKNALVYAGFQNAGHEASNVYNAGVKLTW